MRAAILNLEKKFKRIMPRPVKRIMLVPMVTDSTTEARENALQRSCEAFRALWREGRGELITIGGKGKR